MKARRKHIWMALLVAGTLLGGKAVFGQSQTAPQQPGQAPSNKPAGQQVAPLTVEPAAPPVSAEEEAAMKGFRDAPASDLAKKDQMGEDFVQKYPQSRYRAEVYNWLVKGYLSTNQVDKMEVAGDKELELVPNDAQTLAIVGSTLPRAMNASTPDPQKRLAKAEQYCKKALELLPTLVKPESLTDEAFQKAKDQTAAMAYSGLGLVQFRRGKYAEAIPNFEQSAKLDPMPDPVNYYLLGVSNEKASHFDDAVSAFSKCAEMPGGMQVNCKNGAEEAKKLAATQLSAPK